MLAYRKISIRTKRKFTNSKFSWTYTEAASANSKRNVRGSWSIRKKVGWKNVGAFLFSPFFFFSSCEKSAFREIRPREFSRERRKERRDFSRKPVGRPHRAWTSKSSWEARTGGQRPRRAGANSTALPTRSFYRNLDPTMLNNRPCDRATF